MRVKAANEVGRRQLVERGLAYESLSPAANEGSDEEGLQRDPKGSDGAELMFFEGPLEMFQREQSGMVGCDLRWLTQLRERRADGGLGQQEPFPNPIGCRIA